MTPVDDISSALANVEANEDDAQWHSWVRQFRRVQEQVHERERTITALVGRLGTPNVQAAQPSPPVDAPDSPWMSPDDAALYVGHSRRSLERMMEDSPKVIPPPWRKVGRSVRWNRDQMNAWIDNLNNLKRAGRRR